MQISVFNYHQNNNSPQFKSAIPVYHWVRETGGSFAPVADIETTKKIQEIFVKFLNKPYCIKHSDMIKKAIKMLKDTDIYYSHMIKFINATGKKFSLTRSFYNQNGGWTNNLTDFSPISYLITGSDVNYFNNNFAKDIGKSIAVEKSIGDEMASADLKMARNNYFKNGYNFVKDTRHQIRDMNGIPYGIHTKFEIIRKNNGEVGYKFIDMKFLPEKGSTNPFERLAMRKQTKK